MSSRLWVLSERISTLIVSLAAEITMPPRPLELMSWEARPTPRLPIPW
jgi:hypothetical protein